MALVKKFSLPAGPPGDQYEGVPPVTSMFARAAKGESEAEAGAKKLAANVVGRLLSHMFEAFDVRNDDNEVLTGWANLDDLTQGIIAMLPKAEHFDDDEHSPALLAPSEGALTGGITPDGSGRCTQAAGAVKGNTAHMGSKFGHWAMIKTPRGVPYVGMVRNTVSTPPYVMTQEVSDGDFHGQMCVEGCLQGAMDFVGNFTVDNEVSKYPVYDPTKAERKMHAFFARTGDVTTDTVTAWSVLSAVFQAGMTISMIAYSDVLGVSLDPKYGVVKRRLNRRDRMVGVDDIDVNIHWLRTHEEINLALPLIMKKVGDYEYLTYKTKNNVMFRSKGKRARDHVFLCAKELADRMTAAPGEPPIDFDEKMAELSEKNWDAMPPMRFGGWSDMSPAQYVSELLSHREGVAIVKNPLIVKKIIRLVAADGTPVPDSKTGDQRFEVQGPPVFLSTGEQCPLHYLLSRFSAWGRRPFGLLEWVASPCMEQYQARGGKPQTAGAGTASAVPKLTRAATFYVDGTEMAEYLESNAGGDDGDVRSTQQIQASEAIDAFLEKTRTSDMKWSEMKGVLREVNRLKRRTAGLRVPLSLPPLESCTLESMTESVDKAFEEQKDVEDAESAFALTNGDEDHPPKRARGGGDENEDEGGEGDGDEGGEDTDTE